MRIVPILLVMVAIATMIIGGVLGAVANKPFARPVAELRLSKIPQADYSIEAWGGLLKMKNTPIFYVSPSSVMEGYDPAKQQTLLWIDLAARAYPTANDAHPIAITHFKNFGWWAEGPCPLIFALGAASDDRSQLTINNEGGLFEPTIPPDDINWVATAQAVGHSKHSGDCD